jgi:sulfur carrier protein
MRLVVNGEERTVDGVPTVADLVTRSHGVAVAVDGEIVPRSTWPDRTLHDGASVEILTAVQGG